MSAQPITFLTKEEAHRLTERIRTALDRVSTAWADLVERVAEAFDRRADLALGYTSWAEYAEAELRPPTALAAEVRRELVGLLSARGMSTRAIAPTVGVSGQRVRQIVAEQVASDLPPEPERINPITGEITPTVGAMARVLMPRADSSPTRAPAGPTLRSPQGNAPGNRGGHSFRGRPAVFAHFPSLGRPSANTRRVKGHQPFRAPALT